MVIKYLDKHGTNYLVDKIKELTTALYKVKGQAIYADAVFLALTPAEKEAIATGASAITTAGLWKEIQGTWTKLDTFAVTDVGNVYDIINAFDTSADFVEGADHHVDEGANIVLVNQGTEQAPVFKWDLLPGLLNLDKYQTKKLVAPLQVFDNETPTVYTSAASLPTTEAAATATITDLMVAIMGTGDEEGDVYRAHVAPNATDPTQNDITWVKLGDQLTVEGALAFLGNTCPNTPITDAEIDLMFEP